MASRGMDLALFISLQIASVIFKVLLEHFLVILLLYYNLAADF